MKLTTQTRRLIRPCRIRARTLGRILAMQTALQEMRRDARAVRGVALRFRKPVRTFRTEPRESQARPRLESRIEQHLHFAWHLHVHTGGARRQAPPFSTPASHTIYTSPALLLTRPAGTAPDGRTEHTTVTRFRSVVRAERPFRAHTPDPQTRQLSLPHSALTPRLRRASARFDAPSDEGTKTPGSMLGLWARRVASTSPALRDDTPQLQPRAVPPAFEKAHSRRTRTRVQRLVRTIEQNDTDVTEAVRLLSSRAKHRSVELVWRKPERQETAARAVDLETAAPEMPTPPRPVEKRAVSSPDLQRIQTALRGPVAFPQLDPGTVDRLAEDVMRRIDKRARIERERRGL